MMVIFQVGILCCINKVFTGFFKVFGGQVGIFVQESYVFEHKVGGVHPLNTYYT